MPALSSSFVGSYRLLYMIRSGRFCQVWAAIDDSTQRRFALKFLLPEFRNDKEQLLALRHEYEIGSKLKGSLLLGAYGFGEAASCGPYLMMELFVGVSLRDILRDTWAKIQPIMPSIITQTVESVAQLHEMGHVHLDIKPDNLMVNEQEEVRLIDFALARSLPGRWERWFWKKRQKTIQGTRSYLSPEQIRREPIDFRSDVYGLGCTLYQLASNVLPYTAPQSNELLIKHLHFPLPNLEVDNPAVSTKFAQLVMKMMAKKPDQRFASAREVAQELKLTPIYKQDEAATAKSSPPMLTK